MKTGRVLIVSSHPLFAEGLTRLVQEAGCRNEMVVHEQRWVAHATADELIRVLRAEL